MWLGELHSPWGSVGVLCVGPVVLVVGIRLLDQEEWGPVGWGERPQWTWAILPGPLVVHPRSRLEVIGRARAWVRPSSSGEQRDADEAVRRLTSRTWCEGVWNRDSSAEDVFTLPVYFSSDWLNEYWDALDVDDYRFIYMGPTGTWSPFHADIFRSFSWSVNICGRKKWFFFPPGQEEALRDCHGGLPYDVTSPALLDSRLYPMRKHCSPPLELTQEAGEMVFVPSGWHHQVHNLEDTISINHNWVNGCNLANMWHFLQQELRAVQQEVSQWRDTMPDWHRHCQVIMRSCSGINFEEFYHFLKIIAERRLLLLAKGMGPGTMEGGVGTGLGPQQAAFDVSRITEVLASVVAHPDFQKLDTSMFSPQPEELLPQLEEVVATAASI
ncbi:2-oxoglutarate and iron-dependent oxygenase JMJD4 isoform X2 [Ursus maritimus]|uniref:Jumonji domain-containing protein 4 n=1 Tax=Ursus maritimus TaxID=29073 RepID=A0A8M1FD60_URSMA|nr:2-oxoglutarate and iron-dependent oxygenase JMJD4 isoform X2 [Ursus maritimus]